MHSKDHYKDFPQCAIWEICPFRTEGMCSENVTEEEKEDLRDMLKVYSAIVLVVSCLLLFFGVLGNVVTLLVLRGRSLREKLLSTLVKYECVINIIDLFIGLGRLIVFKAFGVDYRLLSKEACILQHGLFFTCHMVEHWNFVYMVITRFIYMVRPEKGIYLRISCAHFVMIITLIVLGAFNFKVALIDTSFISQYAGGGEQFRSCKWDTSGVLFFCQMALLFYVPATITVSLNIACYIHYRNTLSDIQDAITGIYFTGLIHTKKNAGLAIVKLIFFGNVLFFVTACPFAVTLPGVVEWDDGTIKRRVTLYFGFKVTVFLLYASRAVWFVTYYIVGKRFRRQCSRMLMRCWLRCKKNVLRRPVSASALAEPSTETHTSTVDEIGIIKERLYAMGPTLDRQSYAHVFGADGHLIDVKNLQPSVSKMLRRPSMILRRGQSAMHGSSRIRSEGASATQSSTQTSKFATPDLPRVVSSSHASRSNTTSKASASERWHSLATGSMAKNLG